VLAPLFRDRLSAALDLQYTGSRATYRQDVLGGFAVANLTLTGRRLIKGLDLSFSSYNLFNKKYADAVSPYHTQNSVIQDGRGLRLKLTYRLRPTEANP